MNSTIQGLYKGKVIRTLCLANASLSHALQLLCPEVEVRSYRNLRGRTHISFSALLATRSTVISRCITTCSVIGRVITSGSVVCSVVTSGSVIGSVVTSGGVIGGVITTRTSSSVTGSSYLSLELKGRKYDIFQLSGVRTLTQSS